MSRARILTYAIGGALIMLLSFATTLWLTEPEIPAAERIATFANSAISDERGLGAAAQAAGLKNSPYLKGKVDVVTRVDASRVSLTGWAAETIAAVAKGAPLTVMAFGGGRKLMTIQTQGERPDVAQGFKLIPAAAKNIAFTGEVACRGGDKIVVAVVAIDGTYSSLDPVTCP